MKPGDKVFVFNEYHGVLKKKAKDDRWLVEWRNRDGVKYRAEVAEEYLKVVK